MEIIRVNSATPKEFTQITNYIEQLIIENEWKDGLLTICSTHPTFSVLVTENSDLSVLDDIIDRFSFVAPKFAPYSHGDGNSDAFIISAMVGNSVQVILTEGKLALGVWQDIYMLEQDGPKEREIYVDFIEKK